MGSWGQDEQVLRPLKVFEGLVWASRVLGLEFRGSQS